MKTRPFRENWCVQECRTCSRTEHRHRRRKSFEKMKILEGRRVSVYIKGKIVLCKVKYVCDYPVYQKLKYKNVVYIVLTCETSAKHASKFLCGVIICGVYV